MADTIQHTKVVAATVQQMDASHIVVTYQDGQDADQVSQMIAEVTESTGSSHAITLGQPGSTTPLKVGSTLPSPVLRERTMLSPLRNSWTVLIR